MDTPRKWPTGIKPRGRGLQVEIWNRGRRVYSKILPCDPYSPADLAAAVEHRRDQLARVRLGQPLRGGDPGVEIFADVADRWLSSLQIGKRQIRKYFTTLNSRWMPAYASWPVTDISTADIQERLAAMGVAVKTQKNYLTPLRGVLAHAGMNPNPCDAVTWPSMKRARKKNQRRERYTLDERARLLKRLDTLSVYHGKLAEEKPTQGNKTDAHWSAQAALYFRIFFGIGTRPGETLALTREVYDGSFVWIEGQYVRSEYEDTTKTGNDRRVYVPTTLRPYLDNHPSRFTGGPILTGFQGGPLKDTKRLNKWWRTAHSKERIKYRDPYVCRHTRASELLSRGVSAAEGAYQLGHSIQMFAELYSTFIEEFRQEQDWSRFETSTTQKQHSAEDDLRKYK